MLKLLSSFNCLKTMSLLGTRFPQQLIGIFSRMGRIRMLRLENGMKTL